MKTKILTILVVTILLVSSMYITIGAESEGGSGKVDSSGNLQMIGTSAALQTAVCTVSKSNPSMADCATNTIKNVATSMVMQEIAKSDPDAGKIISTYQQLQPLINKGGKAEGDIDKDGKFQGTAEPPKGEETDLKEGGMTGYDATVKNANIESTEKSTKLTNQEGTNTIVENGDDKLVFNEGTAEMDKEKEGVYTNLDIVTAEQSAFQYEMGAGENKQRTKVSVPKGMSANCNEKLEGCVLSGDGKISIDNCDKDGNPIAGESFSFHIASGDKVKLTTDDYGNYVINSVEGQNKPTILLGEGLEAKNVGSATIYGMEPETRTLSVKFDEGTSWEDHTTGWKLDINSDNSHVLTGPESKKDSMIDSLTGEPSQSWCYESTNSLSCSGGSYSILQENKGVNIETKNAQVNFQEDSGIKKYTVDASSGNSQVMIEENLGNGKKIVSEMDEAEWYTKATTGAPKTAEGEDASLIYKNQEGETYAGEIDKENDVLTANKMSCPLGPGTAAVSIDSVTGMQSGTCQAGGDVSQPGALTEAEMKAVMKKAEELDKNRFAWNVYKSNIVRASGFIDPEDKLYPIINDPNASKEDIEKVVKAYNEFVKISK